MEENKLGMNVGCEADYRGKYMPIENTPLINDVSEIGREDKITAWVAREQDGTLNLYVGGMPFKGTNFWKLYDELGVGIERLNKESFPQVKWEDKEPTEVELTIKICK